MLQTPYGPNTPAVEAFIDRICRLTPSDVRVLLEAEQSDAPLVGTPEQQALTILARDFRAPAEAEALRTALEALSANGRLNDLSSCPRGCMVMRPARDCEHRLGDPPRGRDGLERLDASGGDHSTRLGGGDGEGPNSSIDPVGLFPKTTPSPRPGWRRQPRDPCPPSAARHFSKALIHSCGSSRR
jgi:hypothetical protein